uniref:Serine-threonine/tyrosine-protein kinase catalytic domain-containing protein n=1 Tax=Populus davidiana TaxID=266767 RepID=A0A6M2EJS3_9ROSI
MLQKKGDQDRVIDIVENLEEYRRSDREEITRMIKVAAWCLQDDPERRPLMSTVLKVLEGVMEVDSNINYRFSHAMLQLVTTIFLQHLLQHLFFPILDDVVVRLPLLVASATFPSCYPKLTTAFLALV